MTEQNHPQNTGNQGPKARGEETQFVVLPMRGLRASGELAKQSAAVLSTMIPGPEPASGEAAALAQSGLRVLKSMGEDAAKLIAATPEQLRDFRIQHPELRVVPLVHYRLCRVDRPQPRALAAPAAIGMAPALNVEIVDAAAGTPIEGAHVIAFTNWSLRLGAQAVSNAAGRAHLNLGGSPASIERLYVYPPLGGYWGIVQEHILLYSGDRFDLEPIDLSTPDGRQAFLPLGAPGNGAGVKVAVVDTGVGPHVDLPATGDRDNGDGHGTHVAGVIGGRGTLASGLPGLAPACHIHSYRVFAGNGVAASFDVAAAIDQAVQDGCDLVNLSLGYSGGYDPTVAAAIEDAWDRGVVCFAASGNDDRKPVDFPANHSLAVGVSALGKIGTFPSGSIDEVTVVPPYGTDPDDFVAAFSNVGPEIAVTAPGVAIISAVPNDEYGWMHGTSMACPAAVGVTARLLGNDPGVLGMARSAARSAAIRGLTLRAAARLGFPASFEGAGLPR